MNSIGKLYINIPEPEKKNAFDAGKEISESEYVRMLREYSTTIGTGTPRNKVVDNRYRIYEINNKQQEEDLYFTTAETKIYDISGKPCDIRELYRIQKNGMGVLIIEVVDDKIDDSFETEFKFWKKESMNINTDPEIDKDERLRFLPIKNLKFEIDNHLFLFSGCKLYCEYQPLKVALIIQSIEEI